MDNLTFFVFPFQQQQIDILLESHWCPHLISRFPPSWITATSVLLLIHRSPFSKFLRWTFSDKMNTTWVLMKRLWLSPWVIIQFILFLGIHPNHPLCELFWEGVKWGATCDWKMHHVPPTYRKGTKIFAIIVLQTTYDKPHPSIIKNVESKLITDCLKRLLTK